MTARRALGAITALMSASALLWATPSGAAPAPKSVDLSAAFNVDCVAGEGRPLVEGDCTGAHIGASFVQDKFPSGRVVLAGIPFTIGPTSGMSPNAASGTGKVLKVNAPAGYKWAQVLVTAVNQTLGTKAADALVATYTDGTKTTGPMGSYDWSDKDHANSAAITAPNENLMSPAATQVSSIRYAYIESVPLNPKRGVATLTMSGEGTNIRVFAITLTAGPAQKAKSWTPS